MRQFASACAELGGLTMVNVGFWQIHTVAGLFATGLSFILVGLAVDPPRKQQPRTSGGRVLGLVEGS
ncbi:hypothetical protein [Mycolicibacterium fortuitum]|uniref:hypothetical protein n=1 Tax=Mycolicibacterium fortuitum TaxID=1766 RepID=UPI0007EB01AF|nr:hypothetical protein [Mycolicibacterium fortuitum]